MKNFRFDNQIVGKDVVYMSFKTTQVSDVKLKIKTKKVQLGTVLNMVFTFNENVFEFNHDKQELFLTTDEKTETFDFGTTLKMDLSKATMDKRVEGVILVKIPLKEPSEKEFDIQ